MNKHKCVMEIENNEDTTNIQTRENIEKLFRNCLSMKYIRLLINGPYICQKYSNEHVVLIYSHSLGTRCLYVVYNNDRISELYEISILKPLISNVDASSLLPTPYRI